MKSSFAKTFRCVSKNDKKLCDLVHPEREVTKTILCDDEKINPTCIFVADAESEIYSDDKITTLLASQQLKRRYDKVYQILDEAKKGFLKKLKEISQSSDCEEEVVSTFKKSEKDDFFDCMVHLQDQINKDNAFFQFKYNDVFDKKGNVKKFLDKYKKLFQEYFNEYNNLLSMSAIFKKNKDGTSFGTYQANQIIKSVDGNAFFSAEHKMVLSNSIVITSKSQLEETVNNEINKILANESLRNKYRSIDDAIGNNAELRAFKALLENNMSIIPYLLDYDGFKNRFG